MKSPHSSAPRASRQSPPAATDRRDRLKAALKANIARRKAQAASRADKGPDPTDTVPTDADPTDTDSTDADPTDTGPTDKGT